MSNKQGGLTLIETIASIVIIAISLTGVTLALRFGTSQSANTMVELRAVALAQAYLDEIMGKRFDERTRNRGIPPCRATAPPARQCTAEGSFGPDGGETRSRYDDVDDYHGLDEGDGQVNPLQDATGATRTGYDNFRVQVEVRYINLGVGEEEENLPVNNEYDDQFDAKLITLTVSYRGLSQGYTFSAYKSNF
ncbi:MAG: prepilin-type N-terminal cleavage/methylation domain-containing protein [Gammaproteobacteria bacterium]